MRVIPVREPSKPTLSLPFECQCDICKQNKVASFHFHSIKTRIQLFGLDSFRSKVVPLDTRRAA